MGRPIAESVPRIIDATYCVCGLGLTGVGPFQFGPAPSPLAFAITSRLPSGLSPRADGYQPVGTAPTTFARARSTTSMALFPARATNAVPPSDETAIASGLEPTGSP